MHLHLRFFALNISLDLGVLASYALNGYEEADHDKQIVNITEIFYTRGAMSLFINPTTT